MAETEKYHAIKIDTKKCFGCTHCLKVCPTEAIRIRGGIAVIDEKRCVDCGNCLRVCPADAFYIEQDDLNRIKQFKYPVALIPAVMIGQFPEQISEDTIYAALLKIGFSHIFEVEQPIRLLIESISEFSNQNNGLKPLISSFCPAVVRLIQAKYPSLAGNIILRRPPHDLAAFYAVEKLKNQGIDEKDIGFFYITPCSAKMAALKRPFDEKTPVINGIINMRVLYNRVMQEAPRIENTDTSAMRDELSREGILWSLAGGEARVFKKRAMAVDGIHNVVKILERLENGKLPDIEFLDFRSCDQGCAGGILLSGNRFLTAGRLKKRVKSYPLASAPKDKLADISKIKGQLITGPILPRPVFNFGNDRIKALEKITKASRIVCQLPGIDCGACGAPNCQALAEDMVQGQAKMSDCVYLQQRWQKEGKITAEKAFANLEKKWGSGRFNADCNKKGARNEGF